VIVGGSPAILHICCGLMCYVTQTQDMCTIQTCHEHMMLEKHLICGVLAVCGSKQTGAIHLQRYWYHWLAVTADSLGALLSLRCSGLEAPSSNHPGGALCQATSGADLHWKHSPHHCPCMHHLLVGWPESVGRTCGETGGLIWPGRACCLLIEAGLAF
jgi:hypothetical protein